MKRRNDDRTVLGIFIGAVLFQAALYGAIAYVAVHFISKVW